MGEQRGAASPADVLAPGAIVSGKYEVERVLGAGGMGVVVAARHLQLGQRVAIKFMHGDAAQDADAVERFLREARTAVALTSEHVARVLDVGKTEGGAPYMVMEYLAGEDLAHALRRQGPMPVAVAVGYVLQACDALAEAHSLGVVHRDLKPANLFVTARRDGSALVKVLDFGISKAALPGHSGEAQGLTVSGTLMGSPAYMSPEQVRSSRNVDARSDVWSLGVILYELLTGVSPFVGETLGDTFAKVTSETPPSIRLLRAELPRGLSRVVERCLDRKLEARIESVSHLAAGLAEFAGSEADQNVGRVLRGSSGPVRASHEETLVASPTITCGPDVSPGRSDGPGMTETGPPWLRSSSTRSPRRPDRVLVRIAGVAAMLAVAAGGTVWTRVIFSRARSVAGSTSTLPPVAKPPPDTQGLPSLPTSGMSTTTIGRGAQTAAGEDEGVTAAPSAPPMVDAGSRAMAPGAQPRPPAHLVQSALPKTAIPQTTPAPGSSASTARHEVDVF